MQKHSDKLNRMTEEKKMNTKESQKQLKLNIFYTSVQLSTKMEVVTKRLRFRRGAMKLLKCKDVSLKTKAKVYISIPDVHE